MRGDTLLLRNADLLCTMNPADSSDPAVRAGDNVDIYILGKPHRATVLEGPPFDVSGARLRA